MQFDELDEEYFQQQINEFVGKFGAEPLKEIYRIHRNLSKTLFIKNLPVVEMFRRVFFDDFQRELNTGDSLNKIAIRLSEKEGISKRTIYDYYKYHYKRIKKLRKSTAQ
jgi:hypothetical protein